MNTLSEVMNKEMSVYFIDWDDTLFPTSYLNSVCGDIAVDEMKITPSLHLEFHRLSKIIVQLFERLKDHQIFIVTLATVKWVKETINRFYPLLKDHKLNITSARYSDIDFVQQKKRAFVSLLPNGTNRIVSIGDSEIEAGALCSIRQTMGITGTVIKMMNNPNITQLSSQLNFILHNIDLISSVDCSIGTLKG